MGFEKVRRPIMGNVDDRPTEIKPGLDYSTAETDTGLKWIDGAAVYQKVLEFAAGPNNSTVNVAHGVTGLLTVIDVQGFMDDGTHQRPINNVESTDVAQCHYAVDDTNVILLSGTPGADYSGYAGFVVLRYTKS